MKKSHIVDFSVGAFFILAIAAFFFLATVTGRTTNSGSEGYELSARFEDVSGLANNSVVRLSGVIIGQVEDISVLHDTYSAMVHFRIDDPDLKIPDDSTIGVYTEGILGAKYLAIIPGFSEEYVKPGQEILRTKSAVVLENLFSKILLLIGTEK